MQKFPLVAKKLPVLISPFQKPVSVTHTIVCALLCMFLALPGFGSENYWQLTLNYTEGGELELLSADQIAPSAKSPRTPNGEGGLFEIPIRVDWFDDAGASVFTSQALMPLGTRIMCAEDNPVPGFIMPKNLVVLRLPGPAAVDVSEVRISRQTTMAKRSASFNTPDLSEDFTFALKSPKTRTYAPPPPSFPTTKIRDTGPDGSRLVIVVMGDGYHQSEINNGKFATDVDRTLAAFNSASPWDQMLKATNVYRVDVPSAQSGADLEGGLSGLLKNTYFDTSFYTRGIQQLLTPSDNGKSRAVAVADATAGAGIWDQIILVVNSTVYGGAGGPLTTASVNVHGPSIAVHEVGHSFPGLADEYGGDIRIYDGLPIIEPNVTQNPNNPSWAAWIDSPATPLPTPDTPTYDGIVGAFQGGRYYNTGIFRPTRNCRMRNVNVEFCPVCKEQHLRAFFDIVPFAESATPAPSDLIKISDTRTFTVNATPIDDVTYEWFVDGEKIAGAASSTLTRTSAQLTAPEQQISVTANYTSPMMRTGQPNAAFSWNVENIGVTSSGTPHWWLAKNAIAVAGNSDLGDPDSDGQNTTAEYLAGTNPRDSSSVLGFTMVNLSPIDGRLEFETIPGRRYKLERATSLDNWEPVPGYENITGGPTIIYQIPANRPTKRFFRIGVWIP